MTEQTVETEEEYLEWLRKQTGLFTSLTPVRPVKGKKSDSKCGPRCRMAFSRTCSCSCGGALHGSFL